MKERWDEMVDAIRKSIDPELNTMDKELYCQDPRFWEDFLPKRVNKVTTSERMEIIKYPNDIVFDTDLGKYFVFAANDWYELT